MTLGAGGVYFGLGSASFRGDGPNEMGDFLPFVNLGTTPSATQFGVAEVQVGGSHTCVRFGDGRVKCFGGGGGSGSNGILGLGSSITTTVTSASMGDALPFLTMPGNRLALSISVNMFSSCAALDSGEVACWVRSCVGPPRHMTRPP